VDPEFQAHPTENNIVIKTHGTNTNIFAPMSRPVLKKRLSLNAIAREPFRILFPAGVLAGIVGVSLWPLHFLGVLEMYPGQNHARIMACGLFGAFIFGFLGTAMPRMLSAQPLKTFQLMPIVLLHLAMVIAFACSKIFAGDVLFFAMLLTFIALMLSRAKQRKDTPPPGFILVGMSFLSVLAGTALAVAQHFRDLDPFWITLQRLLSYQGFVLLPILGIGPFILPRLFGMQSQHDFPEMLIPARAWWRKAALAFTAGALVIASFFIEVNGSYRIAHWLRFGVAFGYMLIEMPFHRAPAVNALGIAVRIAFAGIVAGFLAVAIFPTYRVGLLHLTLVGGFAVITFVVATRVVFGHSGNGALLKGRNRWLLVAIGLMLFGMATRISGDFWPKILASHYIYGALIWIAGVVLWSIYVLPRVLVMDDE
jgi:uncharacterized protein involved in response to NO